MRAPQSVAAGRGQGASKCNRCATDVASRRCRWIHRRAAPMAPAHPCQGACAPPMRRCKEARARGTRPAGSTARTCWRPSALRRTLCRIPRRGGRCVEGGRAATRGRDGGARGGSTSVRGVPDLQQAGADAAPVVPAERLLLDLPPRVIGENPVVVKGGDEVISRRAGVPLGGAAIYTWRPVRWGVSMPHWHSSAASRWRGASRLPSATASHPTHSPSQLSSSWGSAAARSVGSLRSKGPWVSSSRDRALLYTGPHFSSAPRRAGRLRPPGGAIGWWPRRVPMCVSPWLGERWRCEGRIGGGRPLR